MGPADWLVSFFWVSFRKNAISCYIGLFVSLWKFIWRQKNSAQIRKWKRNNSPIDVVYYSQSVTINRKRNLSNKFQSQLYYWLLCFKFINYARKWRLYTFENLPPAEEQHPAMSFFCVHLVYRQNSFLYIIAPICVECRSQMDGWLSITLVSNSLILVNF